MQTKSEIKKALSLQKSADFGKITFAEFYGEDQAQSIRNRVEELLQSKKGGFIILGNSETGKISDAYMAICGHHVIENVIKTVKSAEELGILAKCTCKNHE